MASLQLVSCAGRKLLQNDDDGTDGGRKLLQNDDDGTDGGKTKEQCNVLHPPRPSLKHSILLAVPEDLCSLIFNALQSLANCLELTLLVPGA